MTALGADYSAGRPSGAALAAAGVSVSLRYIRQGSPGKLLTLAEYEDLTAHNITVIGVSEGNTHDMETGRSAGVAAAQADRAWLQAAGIPLRRWACACDEHLAAGGPIATAVAHAQGYADVLGPDGGCYGPIELMQAIAADGIADALWRWMWCHEPTAAQIAALALFAWQRNTGTAVIGGVTCDLNTIYRNLEDDVELSDTVYTRPDGGLLPGPRTLAQVLAAWDQFFIDGAAALGGVPDVPNLRQLGNELHQLSLGFWTGGESTPNQQPLATLIGQAAAATGITLTDAQLTALAAEIAAKLPTPATPSGWDLAITPKATPAPPD
jgi:hypothetical protein